MKIKNREPTIECLLDMLKGEIRFTTQATIEQGQPSLEDDVFDALKKDEDIGFRAIADLMDTIYKVFNEYDHNETQPLEDYEHNPLLQTLKKYAIQIGWLASRNLEYLYSEELENNYNVSSWAASLLDCISETNHAVALLKPFESLGDISDEMAADVAKQIGDIYYNDQLSDERYDLAIRQYRLAIGLGHQDPEAHRKLGNAYCGYGVENSDKEFVLEGIKHLEEALELGACPMVTNQQLAPAYAFLGYGETTIELYVRSLTHATKLLREVWDDEIFLIGMESALAIQIESQDRYQQLVSSGVAIDLVKEAEIRGYLIE